MPRQRRFIIRRIASYGKAVFHFPPEDEALLYLRYGKKTPISFSIHKSAITDFNFLTDFFDLPTDKYILTKNIVLKNRLIAYILHIQ